MATSYEKLSALLKELFQLDQADLDFGIYRIMNQKRDEITRFLDNELLPQVKTAFGQYIPADRKTLEEKLQQASQAAIAAGFEPEQSPKVKEIREQLAGFNVDTMALENEVYSHLYSFFRRYYDNGDFISMRRYKEGVYAIPYEGEEVKLHWANADQYYVKTTENFRDYSFRLPSGRLAHFKVVEAETEKDNIKAADEKNRRFILAAEHSIQVEGGELILRFEYRSTVEKLDQKALNAQAAETLLAHVPSDWKEDLKTLKPTETNPRRTLLEKHLTDYTARNTFDYFIHKDLRGFLNRELDFYIKNEIMRLDDIENLDAPRVEQYLSLIKVIRVIAHKIIEFLAQIEDFQKRLWLKKKFVVEANYCITLDRVPEEFFPEICANDAQREEWVHLYGIDEIKGDLISPGYTIPLTINFLKSKPTLILDTSHFDQIFFTKLLLSFDKLESNCDGIIIQSENSQALTLLKKKYEGSIQCVYIDPPYNSGADGFIYKDNYQHSTWLSMMENRLWQAKSFLKKDSILGVSIDNKEQPRLRILLDTLLPETFVSDVANVNNPQGRSDDEHIATAHESLIIHANPDCITQGWRAEENVVNRFRLKDKKGKYRETDLRKTGKNDRRIDRPNLFYYFYYNSKTNDLFPAREEKEIEGYVQIKPIRPDGSEGNWRWELDTAMQRITNLVAKPMNRRNIWTIYEKDYLEADPRVKPSSVWNKSTFNSHFASDGFADLGFSPQDFPHPKPVDLISSFISLLPGKEFTCLDFFVGSGTTGHAIINLNHEDQGNRKYILIEMGSYFDAVLIPRIKKVIYSKLWKDGKPISSEGSSHCFKYLRLESYEDALNNLTLQRAPQQQLALEANPEFKEHYMLSYMLDAESQGSLLNIQSFVHPFDYRLNIASGAVGESKPTCIDLVETFNYLIGLHVETMQTIRGFRVVTGKNPAGERTLIIWRDLQEKSNTDLEEFFRKQDYNPRDMEFDLIYVNGDNNLENLRRPDETWKVRLIEEEFLRLMFEEN